MGYYGEEKHSLSHFLKPMKRNNGPRQTTAEWEAGENGECDTCYCVNLEQQTGDLTYFDLVFNTEQYTGYNGRHIWNILYSSIDRDNKSGQDGRDLIFKAVSGLHASVTIHLCYKYVKQKDDDKDVSVESIVRPNPEELAKRFHPKTTDNQGPSWVRNLYFAYLLIMRSIAEGEPYWRNLPIDTGDKKADEETRNLLVNFMEVPALYLEPLEEEWCFSKGDLNQRCSVYFQNLSGAFDHITCERCRLWGKIQIIGVRTAFKILCNRSSGMGDEGGDGGGGGGLKLTQAEVVSLFNTLGRLSESIRFLGDFKLMKDTG